MRTVIFLGAAVIAALAPLADSRPAAPPGPDGFPGWPASYDGRPLTPLPLTAREAAIARGFPGRVGRFSDGEREIVLRWVATPTRQLHPASDCFRGLGYRISVRPMRLGPGQRPMSCFAAHGVHDAYQVCEQVSDSAGRTWPDVSAWYWHALWSGRGETWWSVVVAKPISSPAPGDTRL